MGAGRCLANGNRSNRAGDRRYLVFGVCAVSFGVRREFKVEKTTVFITGGAGFIGSRLAVAFDPEVFQVTVFDSFHAQAHDGNPDTRAVLQQHQVRIIQGDVRDEVALGAAIAASRPQIVYHLAAETGTGQSFDLPARYNDVNVMGTARLIEAIRAQGRFVRRVIVASSRSVYGEGACVDDDGQLVAAKERVADDLKRGDFAPKDILGRSLRPVPTNASCPVAPASIYASTKLMQEYLLKQAFWGTKVEVGILRLQNVFGPGQSMNNPYTGVLSIFCRQILEGRGLSVFEDGEITRDFVLVDDVVSAFVAMARAQRMPTEILDIGTGEGVTIFEVACRLMILLGQDPARVSVTGDFRPGDIRHAVADIALARSLLGWVPAHSLDQGLAKLTDWASRELRAIA